MNQRITQFSSQKQLKARARNLHVTNVVKGTALALAEQAHVEQQLRDGKKPSQVKRAAPSQKLSQWQAIAKTFQTRTKGLNARQRELRAVSMPQKANAHTESMSMTGGVTFGSTSTYVVH